MLLPDNNSSNYKFDQVFDNIINMMIPIPKIIEKCNNNVNNEDIGSNNNDIKELIDNQMIKTQCGGMYSLFF